MVPPPALTSLMSITGMRSGWPSTWYSSVVWTRPPSTMAHFAVVPPMSNEISRSAPRTAARLAQPDGARRRAPTRSCARAWTGAASSENAPPLDCVMSELAAEAASAEAAAERAEVAVHDGPDVGVDDGGARPLVLPPLLRDPVRGRDGRRRAARGRRSRRRAARGPGSRYEKRKHHRHGLDALGGEPRARPPARRPRRAARASRRARSGAPAPRGIARAARAASGAGRARRTS